MKQICKNVLLIVTLLLGVRAHSQKAVRHHNWDSSPFFNTKFLSNYDLVKRVLIEQAGFKPVTFTSTDGLELKGLFLERPGAVGTILFCAGFFPGRKEGQAPIFRMLSPDYNILLFDARGHAGSEGPFWSNLGKYGKNEYKDVLGALSFVRENVGGDIVIYGVCTGAFHASHALIKLSRENKIKQYGIKGLIFDSGFSSCVEVSKAGKYHLQKKILPRMLSWYANKKKIRSTYLYRISSYFLTKLGVTLKNWFVMPGLRKLENETNLSDKLHEVDCPIFFIHSKDDNYAPFEQVQQLADSAKDKTCWWIEHSSHALHALKHKHEYQRRLLAFLNSAMQKN